MVAVGGVGAVWFAPGTYDLHELALRRRHDPGGSGLVIEKGQLTEASPRTDLSDLIPPYYYIHCAAVDDVEGVARVALGEQEVLLAQRLQAQHLAALAVHLRGTGVLEELIFGCCDEEGPDIVLGSVG